MDRTIFSFGHGDRSLSDFLACLGSFSIENVADVRSWPASRHHPQFTRETLEPALAAAGFTYRWLGKELGGLRTGGYLEHMATDSFREGMARLSALAREAPTVFFCAEREPVECHRRHIGDELAARGFAVEHIIAPDRLQRPGERPGDQETLFEL
jgi:uncharacterized protein (DUF488 family)